MHLSFLSYSAILGQSALGMVFDNSQQVAPKQYDFIIVDAGTVSRFYISSKFTSTKFCTRPVVSLQLDDLKIPDSRFLWWKQDYRKFDPYSKIPFFVGQRVGTQFDWNFTTIEQAGLNGRTIPYSRGFVLGGSSSLSKSSENLGHQSEGEVFYDRFKLRVRPLEAMLKHRVGSMLKGDLASAAIVVRNAEYFALYKKYLESVRDSTLFISDNLAFLRGPSEDFDRLAAVSGDLGWSWKNMFPYALKSEKHVAAWGNLNNTGIFNPRVHGYGPVSTSLKGNISDLDTRVIQTIQENPGMFSFNLDLNSGSELGTGWMQTSVGNSTRSSSPAAYLHPALAQRANLDLVIETQAIELGPTSHGNVRLVSKDAFQYPHIDPRFLSTEWDIGVTIEAVHTLRQFLSVSSWKNYLTRPLLNGINLTSDGTIEAYVRRTATTIKHPVATCKISRANDIGGVVDAQLVLKKTTGLRVVDASVIVSGNSVRPAKLSH
ncbi:GMC oxidoreductase [Sphaerobolus stellatus SS14]|uniref:GMC oxidoreductase n=1 Tax=Sphaerobolus stellatus (strain SS14) TaxID=990650 RepID=A0A0C9TNI9_SPHS4|nr:GMC oxidoreductase [Sphaerobolus stellatus SS14]